MTWGYGKPSRLLHWEAGAAPAGSVRQAAVQDLRMAAHLCLRGYLHSYHRLQIVGRDRLPGHRSFVMIANHASHLDALCLLAALPLSRVGRAYPAAADDYFRMGWPRVGRAIFTNAVPFSRGVHTRQSLAMCRQLLGEPGNTLILFPEGTRTVTGDVGAFRGGIGSLLAGSNVPVVPCALHGTFDAWPKGRMLPRPRGLRLVIGEPRRYRDVLPGRDAHHRIAEELRQAVQELLCE